MSTEHTFTDSAALSQFLVATVLLTAPRATEQEISTFRKVAHGGRLDEDTLFAFTGAIPQFLSMITRDFIIDQWQVRLDGPKTSVTPTGCGRRLSAMQPPAWTFMIGDNNRSYVDVG
jgi:hypothetical protein